MLALLVAIVLSLFVACCSFRRTMLAWHQSAMVGYCMRLSAALFAIACRPVIVNDFDAGCWSTAHLVALVSPAAGAFITLWSSNALSLPASWHCHVIVTGGSVVGVKPWQRMSSWFSSTSGRRPCRCPSRDGDCNGGCRHLRLSSPCPMLTSPPHPCYHCPSLLVVAHNSGHQPLPAYDAPNDGWLLCCLSLLLIHHPHLSAPAIVRSLTILLPAAIP